MKKFKIPWNLVYPTSKKDLCPMTKIGYYLKAVLDVQDTDIIRQIKVTSLVISPETEEILDFTVLKYLELQYGSKKKAHQNLGMYKLWSYPKIQDNLDIEYIYVEDDFII